MRTSAQKSQKTSGGLGDLQVDNWQENGGKIGIGTLHSVSCHLQGSNWGSVGLGKYSQYNMSSFHLVARPQDLQEQRWNYENRRYYSEDLRDGSLYLFRIG